MLIFGIVWFYSYCSPFKSWRMSWNFSRLFSYSIYGNMIYANNIQPRDQWLRSCDSGSYGGRGSEKCCAYEASSFTKWPIEFSWRVTRARIARTRARTRASVASKNMIFLSYDNTQTQPPQHKKTVAQGPAGPAGQQFFCAYSRKIRLSPSPLEKKSDYFCFFPLIIIF